MFSRLGNRSVVQNEQGGILKGLQGINFDNFPSKVTINEVGARDGLQNVKGLVPTEDKLEFIRLLTDSGCPVIEVTSFVSPKWVPQMGDHAQVMQSLVSNPPKVPEGKQTPIYGSVVANVQGMQSAIDNGAKWVGIPIAASETFSKRNINCSISESLERSADMIDLAKEHGVQVRAGVSCAFGCPLEGEISGKQVAELTAKMLDLGCYEVTIADTIGYGTPGQVVDVLDQVLVDVNVDQVAMHFHNTYGQAIGNIFASLSRGISVIDSSVAGLGGCPFAPGASGNVATEDVLWLLDGLGVEHDVDFPKLLAAGEFVLDVLGMESKSSAGLALKGSKKEKNPLFSRKYL